MILVCISKVTGEVTGPSMFFSTKSPGMDLAHHSIGLSFSDGFERILDTNHLQGIHVADIFQCRCLSIFFTVS